jgi:hypothetical protein
MASPTCRRCGDFLTAESTVLAGLDLCHKCLDPGGAPTGKIALAPPAAGMKKRIPIVLAFLLILGLAGAIGAASGYAVGRQPHVFAIVAVLGVEFASLPFFASIVQHTGLAEWREHVRGKVGFPDATGFSFGFYAPRKIGLTSLTMKCDPVLMAEREDGFVFMGEQVRTMVPASSIVKATVEWVWFGMPRATLRLHLSNGTSAFFSYLDRRTFRGNRALAKECAARINARSRPGGGAS